MVLCAEKKTRLQPLRLEQWFCTLQRKRLWIADFADKAELAERLQAFIRERNEVAHPFAWSLKSAAEALAKCELEPPAKPDEFLLMARFRRFINAPPHLGRRRKMAGWFVSSQGWHVTNVPRHFSVLLFYFADCSGFSP
jgi:hypothetical protein